MYTFTRSHNHCSFHKFQQCIRFHNVFTPYSYGLVLMLYFPDSTITAYFSSAFTHNFVALNTVNVTAKYLMIVRSNNIIIYCIVVCKSCFIFTSVVFFVCDGCTRFILLTETWDMRLKMLASECQWRSKIIFSFSCSFMHLFQGFYISFSIRCTHILHICAQPNIKVKNNKSIAEGPRDALSQLKSCQLLHNCTKITFD